MCPRRCNFTHLERTKPEHCKFGETNKITIGSARLPTHTSPSTILYNSSAICMHATDQRDEYPVTTHSQPLELMLCICHQRPSVRRSCHDRYHCTHHTFASYNLLNNRLPPQRLPVGPLPPPLGFTGAGLGQDTFSSHTRVQEATNPEVLKQSILLPSKSKMHFLSPSPTTAIVLILTSVAIYTLFARPSTCSPDKTPPGAAGPAECS